MNISILTLNREMNLGANLQAYALQHTIKTRCSISGKVDQVARVSEPNSVLWKPKGMKDFLKILKRLLLYSSYKKKITLYRNFQKRYITFTDEVYTDSNASELNRSYDLFISGSDQVWNCSHSHNAMFFQDFVDDDKYRGSYAASIGISKIPTDQQEAFCTSIEKFDFISVREKTAVNIIKDFTGKDAQLCLDPIFLVSTDEWDKMLSGRIEKSSYIFVYAMYFNDALVETIERCRRQTGLKVLSIFRIPGYQRTKYKIVELKTGPLEFINYVKYASYVITSSFHCTAFSLLYGKDLSVIPHAETGSRVVDLLELLDASECMACPCRNDYANPLYNPEITKDKISIYIEQSFRYLDNMINTVRENMEGK